MVLVKWPHKCRNGFGEKCSAENCFKTKRHKMAPEKKCGGKWLQKKIASEKKCGGKWLQKKIASEKNKSVGENGCKRKWLQKKMASEKKCGGKWLQRFQVLKWLRFRNGCWKWLHVRWLQVCEDAGS